MKYLKVFTDFAEDIEQLSDVEVGRLFRAMLQYAEKETVPDLKGNERFLWPNAKRNIDNASQMYDELSATRSAAGKKGAEKRWQTDSKNSKCHFANGKNGYDKDKEKDKDKDIKKENKKKESFSPPTLEEVQTYCKERNSPVDAKQFWEYFNEGNWKDAKGKPVLNWKQKLLTWEKFEAGKAEKQSKGLPTPEQMKSVKSSMRQYLLDG